MQVRNLGHLGKTGSFAVIHLTIAISLGYLLTGSFVMAGLIAFIEPALNTGAHFVFDRWWEHRHGEAASVRKTSIFAGIHFINAVIVIWALTGNLVVAGAMALIEPLVNAVALYFFDRWWARPRRLVAVLA
jgi:uncharacterized membrane protein